MLLVILVVLLVILLLGALPSWPYSRTWGYSPAGAVLTVLVVVVLLWVFGVVR